MNFQAARSCSRKAVLQSSLSGEKGKFYTLSKVVKEIIGSCEASDDKLTIVKRIHDAFQNAGTAGFVHDFELEANQQSLADCFTRWLGWEQKHGSRFIQKGLSGDVVVPGMAEKVYVGADLLIDKGAVYHLVKIHRGKPKMTHHGRTIDTSPSQSSDLYLLQLLGESLNLNKQVIPAFYYLKSKNDKNGYFPLDFESKIGQNVISYTFDDKEKGYMASELNAVKFDINNRADVCNCADCSYTSICNVEFVPRKLPKVEIQTSILKRVKVTSEQEKLVLARDGYYRVNAVAGSGKTTVIALRTLSLLEEEADPEKILMITFTDKARKEMIAKVKGYDKSFYDGWGLETDALQIETFNSWGHKLIAKHHSKFGFTSEPGVVDDLAKRDIIVSLLEKSSKLPVNYEYPFMDLPFAKGAVLEMAQVIDKLKASNAKEIIDVRKLLNSLTTENKWYGKESVVLSIYNDYNDELRNRNVVDYEDQLRLLSELKLYGVFEDLPYEHIIIDEFQDSNPNQISVVEQILMVNQNVRSLVVVGDIMQAIYSFRNTSPENLLQFGNKFRNVVDIDLTENFRSDKGITEWANRIIKKESKLPRPMTAFRGKKKEPELKVYKKEVEAINLMVAQVEEWVMGGSELSEITILARTRNELIRYQKALSGKGFDAMLKVPEVVKDNPYVQSIFALAKYLQNQEDIKSLAFYAKAMGIDPFDTAKVEALGMMLRKGVLQQPSEPEKVNAFFEELEKVATVDYTAKAFTDKLFGMVPVLSKILSYIYKYDAYSVKDTYSVSIPNGNAITLITVHSSKGLEYSNVITMLEKFKATEEEKRLFYVAVTRAQNNLLVLANEKQGDLISLLKK